jgi:hypothetical protein
MSGSTECVYKKRGKVWETECGHKFHRKMIRNWRKECEEEGKDFTCIRCRKMIKKVDDECCYEEEEKMWKTECGCVFSGEFLLKWVEECEGKDFVCPACKREIVVWDNGSDDSDE